MRPKNANPSCERRKGRWRTILLLQRKRKGTLGKKTKLKITRAARNHRETSIFCGGLWSAHTQTHSLSLSTVSLSSRVAVIVRLTLTLATLVSLRNLS